METWQHISEPARRVLERVVRQRLAEHFHNISATKIIWRMSAEDREAVARNFRRYANEQENPNGKTY